LPKRTEIRRIRGSADLRGNVVIERLANTLGESFGRPSIETGLRSPCRRDHDHRFAPAASAASAKLTEPKCWS